MACRAPLHGIGGLAIYEMASSTTLPLFCLLRGYWVIDGFMKNQQEESTVTWQKEFEQWFDPFLKAFKNKAQRKWGPLYTQGLMGPSGRKNMERIARQVAPDDIQQLHHFISTSEWDPEPLEEVLSHKADELVGGEQSYLIVDDTALVKKGSHSVGVAHQYCGQLGKSANCQQLVTLTLAYGEVPVPISLRLYLPEAWAGDSRRRSRADVPDEIMFRCKWQISIEQIERGMNAGLRFGVVLADAGYGAIGQFRQGLSALGLTWCVGILSSQHVYPKDVKVVAPPKIRRAGRPFKHPMPSRRAVSAEKAFEKMGPGAFRTLSWRKGTKGSLKAKFAAVRVRVADGPPMARGRHLPGEEVWLICERRSTGDIKYYLSNQPETIPLRVLAGTIKARWACEQAHQQMKQELGLDHFEGRSWNGLHHHALMTMISFAYLQHLRMKRKKNVTHRTTSTANTTGNPKDDHREIIFGSHLPTLQSDVLLS